MRIGKTLGVALALSLIGTGSAFVLAKEASLREADAPTVDEDTRAAPETRASDSLGAGVNALRIDGKLPGDEGYPDVIKRLP